MISSSVKNMDFSFFYIISFLMALSMSIAGPYWAIFYADVGVALGSISLIFIAYSLAAMVFEIPTGALADTIGRRSALFLSNLSVSLGFFSLVLVGNNLVLLMLINVWIGISLAMGSGSLDAWIIDTIGHRKRSALQRTVLGHNATAKSIGIVLGPLLGGFLVAYGLSLVVVATSVLLFISAWIALVGKEEYFVKRFITLSEYYSDFLKNNLDGFVHVFRNKLLFLMTFINLLTIFGTTLFSFAYKIRLYEISFPLSYLGFASSIGAAIALIALSRSEKLASYLKGNINVLMLAVLSGGIAAIVFSVSSVFIILFSLVTFYMAVYPIFGPNRSPFFSDFLNKRISSKLRSTVNSISFSGGRIGEILGLAVFGLLSEDLGMVIILSGIVMISVSILYLIMKEKD